jgi:hypothetical protein
MFMGRGVDIRRETCGVELALAFYENRGRCLKLYTAGHLFYIFLVGVVAYGLTINAV